jgi:hypothetical protein
MSGPVATCIFHKSSKHLEAANDLRGRDRERTVCVENSSVWSYTTAIGKSARGFNLMSMRMPVQVML